MKLKRKTDDRLFKLVWPTTLPTKDQLQDNDMTGMFITIVPDDNVVSFSLNQEEHIIYAPFSKEFIYEIINEEGDVPWTTFKR